MEHLSQVDGHFNERIAILSALTDLTANKDFDSISISEICDTAHISRSTFYRLFGGKYEIVDWLMGMYAKTGLDQIGRTLTWEEAVHNSIFNLGRHHRFLAAVNIARRVKETPNIAPSDRRRAILYETIESWKGVELTSRLRYQVDTWSRALTDLSARWYCDELDDLTPDEFVEVLVSIVPSELYLLLAEPAQPMDASYSGIKDANSSTQDFAMEMLNALSMKRQAPPTENQ